MNKYFFEHHEVMIDVFSQVITFNTERKKKLKILQDLGMFGENVLLMTGGQSLQDLTIIDPVTGEKRLKH